MHRPLVPDRGPAWVTGYGISQYEPERDIVSAWVQFHTNDGDVRLGYAIAGSVESHESLWRQVAESNGYTLMDGPPLLDD